jgi:glycosyltransferase involved in cell wall biosynthesis
VISPKLRVAIVHDWFQGFHGSERVVKAMVDEVFPDVDGPDLFTFFAASEVLPQELAERIVQESRLANLPGIRQRGHATGRWRYLLPWMPWYFSRLDLDAYEIVVSSSHACAVNVMTASHATHVCYCYTPMRYAWMPATDSRGPGSRSVPGRAMSRWLRRVDRRAAARVDGYVAISGAVRERIRRFYGRDAVVIHPPVDVDDFDPTQAKEPGRFLWVHRLVPYKRPELVIEAFRGSSHRLVMVGVGPLESRLRSDLPPNVELRGWMPRDGLAELYSTSSAFIHVGEEDFGISMVEALAAGMPVIALNRGGATDIVRDGVDGLLLEQPEVGLLREALDRVASRRWDPGPLADRAAEFSRERFVDRFATYVAELHDRRT